jgi:hypothetical protein
LKQQEVWSISVRLQLADKNPDLALFNLAIDSKLHSCDLIKLRLRHISATPWHQHPGSGTWGESHGFYKRVKQDLV